MTGRIRSLDVEQNCGSIRADDGSSVLFDLRTVIEYDAAWLAVGQLVTFELERGSSKAINVSVEREHARAHGSEKRREPGQVRYIGFEQRDSLRTYRFEQLDSGGQHSGNFTITADLGLFSKYHVGIQDGPAICLHLVTAELARLDGAGETTWNRLLTDQDMQAHVASRPAPRERPRPRRIVHHKAASA